MNKSIKTTFFLALILFFSVSCKSDKSEYEQPNIIYILADDLGYGELGSFGQTEIETPNIDRLAEEGMIFTDHYSGSPVCAPARSVLMTGMHTGTSPIRDNSEWGERGDVWSFKSMLDNPELEGQRPLPDSTVTVAQVLKNNGYKTGMVGKWGLGAPHTNSIPTKKGFDFFYGYNCQRIAHSYYPTHLWKNEEREYLDNYLVEKKEHLDKGADIYNLDSYAKYNQNDYAPTLMHKEALNFIDENKNEKFFLYYASLIPHLALQAPKRWEEYYRNKFGKEEPYIGRQYYPALTPKATYAAMISYLDEQVGEVVEKLKEIGKYENTLIIFTSDNGGHNPSKANNGPLRDGKQSVYEGGLKVPTVICWKGKIKENSISNKTLMSMDLFSTILEIAGSKSHAKTDGISFVDELFNPNNKEALDNKDKTDDPKPPKDPSSIVIKSS